MITASKTKTPYCVTITNGDTSVYSDVAKERGGKAEAFRPHEFLCAAYASCFHITLCKLLDKEKLPYEQVIVTVDLDIRGRSNQIFVSVQDYRSYRERQKRGTDEKSKPVSYWIVFRTNHTV